MVDRLQEIQDGGAIGIFKIIRVRKPFGPMTALPVGRFDAPAPGLLISAIGKLNAGADPNGNGLLAHREPQPCRACFEIG